MRAAGVHEFGGRVELLDLPDPRDPGPGEVVVEVAAAGVGNWDELVRTGEWKLGREAPMALGVEVAGTVIGVGSEVTGLKPGDEVLGHPLQLREQGCWAQRIVVDAGLMVGKPAGVSWAVADAFPVPALTAEQVLSESLELAEGDSVLVHGAGGTTGGLIVRLAALRGARVIATQRTIASISGRGVKYWPAPDLMSLGTHDQPYVFVSPEGELHRRSNFGRRAMRPAADGTLARKRPEVVLSR